MVVLDKFLLVSGANSLTKNDKVNDSTYSCDSLMMTIHFLTRNTYNN